MNDNFQFVWKINFAVDTAEQQQKLKVAWKINFTNNNNKVYNC